MNKNFKKLCEEHITELDLNKFNFQTNEKGEKVLFAFLIENPDQYLKDISQDIPQDLTQIQDSDIESKLVILDEAHLDEYLLFFSSPLQKIPSVVKKSDLYHLDEFYNPNLIDRYSQADDINKHYSTIKIENK